MRWLLSGTLALLVAAHGSGSIAQEGETQTQTEEQTAAEADANAGEKPQTEEQTVTEADANAEEKPQTEEQTVTEADANAEEKPDQQAEKQNEVPSEKQDEGDTKKASTEKTDATPSPTPTAPSQPTLRTRLFGRWQSEFYMFQRSRIHYLGDGRYGLRVADVYPFYNTMYLRADDAGIAGLSFHFQGWAGLDLREVHFDERFVADPNFLYLQYRRGGFYTRLGRQMVFSGVAQGLHLDGAHISYQAPFYLGVEAQGGLVFTPKLGPDWYEEDFSSTSADYGAGFTDWNREFKGRDYAYGARIFYRRAGIASAGISLLNVNWYGELSDLVAGADVDLAMFEFAKLCGDLQLDLRDGLSIREADVALDIYPVEALSIALDYRHANPHLFLSRVSILSAFPNEVYDRVGGTVRLHPSSWITFNAGYYQLFYSYVDYQANTNVVTNPDGGDTPTIDHAFGRNTGYEAKGGGRIRFGDWLALLEYRRFSQETNSIHQLRGAAIIPLDILIDGLETTVNGYFDFYKHPINNQNLSLLGDLSLVWRHKGLEVAGAFTAGLTPYTKYELRGMVKVGLGFDWSFMERRSQ